ncbi:MAG: CheB methylesterase domain-containing protein, partial [Butyrivibrio sp.]|nr:CheB methylesterase domain-containing protein [Butyrivibrio sp.]
KDLNKRSLTAAPGAVSSRSLFKNVKTEPQSIKATEAKHSDPKPDTGGLNDLIKKSAGVKRGKSKLVAVACSTGGPKSLQQVIPMLPANLDAGVVLVQHMPKGFTASLASRLNSLGSIKVSEAVDGELIEKGHVYIAPGGMHIKVEKTSGGHIIKYSDEPPRDALKPCANIMYESLKDSDFDEITCVVLTGMGADGTKGIKALADAHRNIHVIGQDAESCVVYGMPRSVAEAGLVDEVRPLEQIAESIIKNVGVL